MNIKKMKSSSPNKASKLLGKLHDKAVQKKSEALRGKRIAVGLCGGIAVVETVKIVRELRRYGADITVFYTPDVLKFITEVPLEWASGKKVVLRAQGEVDHLDDYDLVLIVPATLNTLSKSALALADNAVTLLIASQLGKKRPLLFVPAMNGSLKNHPLFEEYQTRLQSWGAHFLISDWEEDRIKVPAPEQVAGAVLSLF